MRHVPQGASFDEGITRIERKRDKGALSEGTLSFYDHEFPGLTKLLSLHCEHWVLQYSVVTLCPCSFVYFNPLLGSELGCGKGTLKLALYNVLTYAEKCFFLLKVFTVF